MTPSEPGVPAPVPAARRETGPVTYRQPGTVLTDHTFGVPLDHGNPGGQQLSLFAREITAAGRENSRLPWLVFLGEFDADAALDSGAPVFFTGEMIYPWMFGTDPVLRPLRAAAQLLAERESWPDLYDPDRLRANTVPAAAVIYHDDMYVDRQHSLRTAQTIRGIRPWVTNEYEHDGLRTDGVAILDRLIAMARGAA